MNVIVENLETVRCDFDRCDSSMIFRVLLAVVDQLCADIDTDLAMLESLDVPLAEAIDALHPRGVEEASVSASVERIVIDLRLRDGVGFLDTAPFGDAGEIVESFFDIDVFEVPPSVRLTAML